MSRAVILEGMACFVQAGGPITDPPVDRYKESFRGMLMTALRSLLLTKQGSMRCRATDCSKENPVKAESARDHARKEAAVVVSASNRGSVSWRSRHGR